MYKNSTEREGRCQVSKSIKLLGSLCGNAIKCDSWLVALVEKCVQNDGLASSYIQNSLFVAPVQLEFGAHQYILHLAAYLL